MIGSVLQPRDGVFVLFVLAGLLLGVGRGQRLRRGHAELDLPFNRRRPEREDEERQNLERHIEHGGQIEFDFFGCLAVFGHSLDASTSSLRLIVR